MAVPPGAHRGLDPWNAGPVCPDCTVPLVRAEGMSRPESCVGLPLGCPACGEGCDGTPEQIAAVVAAGKAWAEYASGQAERERAAMLADSDAGRAVAALFTVTDLGGSRVQLAIPSLACGGWTAPTGQRAAITSLRDELVAKILEAINPAMQAVLDRKLADQRLSLGASEEHGRKRVGELSRALAAMTAERDALRASGATPTPKQLAMFGESVLPSPSTIIARPPEPAAPSVLLDPASKVRRITACKACGKPGHNRRTCAVREPPPGGAAD